MEQNLLSFVSEAPGSFVALFDRPVDVESVGVLLSGVQEPSRSTDFWRQDCPGDKILVDGEPFEILTSVHNLKDAVLVKRVLNELALKYFQAKIPVVYRRFVQDNTVFYSLFWRLPEAGLAKSECWKVFEQECRRLIGIFK